MTLGMEDGGWKSRVGSEMSEIEIAVWGGGGGVWVRQVRGGGEMGRCGKIVVVWGVGLREDGIGGGRNWEVTVALRRGRAGGNLIGGGPMGRRVEGMGNGSGVRWEGEGQREEKGKRKEKKKKKEKKKGGKEEGERAAEAEGKKEEEEEVGCGAKVEGKGKEKKKRGAVRRLRARMEWVR